MAKIIARQASIGIGKESSRGTAVAPTFWVPVQSYSDVDDKVKTVKNETAIARLESSDGYAVIGKHGELGWSTKLFDSHVGLVFLSLLGSVSSVAKSAPNASVYDHTFSVLQNTQKPSLTIAYKDPNVDKAFPNAVITEVTIKGEVNNYIMIDVKTMSRQSAAATNTISFTDEKHFVPQNFTFKVASAQSGLTAASAVPIRNFSITIKNNAMLEEVLGNVSVNDVLAQSFDVNGSITLVHNATTYSDLQNNGTVQAMRFDLLSADTIGTSSNPQLRLDLHKASITEYSKNMSANELVEESFNFDAHYSIADSKMITVILTNLITSY
jgi:hypothetical protein